jgi:hypothetical protein
MPFGFHLAMDTLPSGNCKRWLQVRLGCIQLSPSCPFRLLHTFLSPGPRGITPAFGYGAPHPSARGTSTLLNNALLSAHYGPLRLPARTVPRLLIRSVRWGSGCPFPALPGLPGSSTDLFLRAVPNHPGRSGGCLLIASPPMSGFIIFGRLATSTLRHEAESGSLSLRLAGLLPRFPPAGLRRLAPVPLHVRMSNLHGEFLSIH